jgi:leucyl/phenylalanyl-tRNA--protein transferase
MSVDVDDIVALGGDFRVDTILSAYERGIFPWPIDGLGVLPWFCPKRRAIVEFDELHLPRSLARARKKIPLTFTIDAAFEQVIRYCASVPRPDGGTWITREVIDGYTALHKAGRAHSVEAWEDGAICGGIYGVEASGYFSAESMFHLRPYASKLALLHLIEHLQSKGLTWLDIQVLTPHMVGIGAKEIPRKEFLKRVAAESKKRVRLFP